MKIFVSLLIGLSTSAYAHQNKSLFATRLSCYQKLSHFYIETATPSTYTSFNRPGDVGRDHASKLITGIPDYQYLVLPTKRSGENGTYIITDNAATWIILPPAEEKTSELSQKDTLCFHFSENEKSNKEIYIVMANNKKWDESTIVKEGKPETPCEEKKFSDLNDEEIETSLSRDLIAKLDGLDKNIMIAQQLIEKRKSKNDPSYKTLELELADTLSALNSCAEGLNKKRDQNILIRITEIKRTLGVEEKPIVAIGIKKKTSK